MDNSRVVIGVPIDSSGNGGGLERAPIVLRRLGLAGAVGATRDFNDMPVRIRGQRDPATGVIGFDSVLDLTREARRQVAAIVGDGLFPVIVGGDCSYLPGVIAGAGDAHGRVGLAYVDGHIDLYDGATSPSGECADMPLAMLLGHGPAGLGEVMGGDPMVAPDDVALLGPRDAADAVAAGSAAPGDYGLNLQDPARLRAGGLTAAGAEAASRFEAGPGRFWLHLDYDVLDEEAFPAVDYLMPGGLSAEEAVALIRPLAASPALIGLSLACYNPELDDPARSSGRLAVEILRRAFAP